MFGSRSRTTCYRFSFALPDENCSTPAILRETSYRHIPKCNERFARDYRYEPQRKCFLSGPNSDALTGNAVKITVASPKPLSRSLSVARPHTQAFTFITRTETQSHLSTEHATETQTHARAGERRQACDMDGLQCSRLKVATATKVVVAGERPDRGASSHHRIIGTMQAHLRSCTVPEKTIHGFGGCLPYAQRRYTKHSA